MPKADNQKNEDVALLTPENTKSFIFSNQKTKEAELETSTNGLSNSGGTNTPYRTESSINTSDSYSLLRFTRIKSITNLLNYDKTEEKKKSPESSMNNLSISNLTNSSFYSSVYGTKRESKDLSDSNNSNSSKLRAMIATAHLSISNLTNSNFYSSVYGTKRESKDLSDSNNSNSSKLRAKIATAHSYDPTEWSLSRERESQDLLKSNLVGDDVPPLVDNDVPPLVGEELENKYSYSDLLETKNHLLGSSNQKEYFCNKQIIQRDLRIFIEEWLLEPHHSVQNGRKEINEDSLEGSKCSPTSSFYESKAGSFGLEGALSKQSTETSSTYSKSIKSLSRDNILVQKIKRYITEYINSDKGKNKNMRQLEVIEMAMKNQEELPVSKHSSISTILTNPSAEPVSERSSSKTP